jgi:hypothetical protein
MGREREEIHKEKNTERGRKKGSGRWSFGNKLERESSSKNTNNIHGNQSKVYIQHITQGEEGKGQQLYTCIAGIRPDTAVSFD